MRQIDDASFEHEVLDARAPVVVDFWAPWCGPCKAVTKVLDELAASHPEVEFVALDIDASPSAASRYDVLSIPTAILFEDGEARETVIGARKRGHYERVWASWLGA
ncbi:MAG: thioredoxin family protein [Gaiellaceae bacterium]